MADSYKSISMSPLTGVLDSRSSVDLEPIGGFLDKRNFEIAPDGKLRHAHGFAKPYNVNPFLQQSSPGIPCPYLNWDWHNQGVAIAARQPPTFLFPSTTNNGVRELIMGTKNQLLKLNELAGQWNQIGGNFGNDGDSSLTQVRFHAAGLNNKVVFVNGFDVVHYYDLISHTFNTIPGLATAGEDGGAVTKAKVVIQWQGVVFLMNFVEDGVSLPSRIRWSNLNDALDWGADPASISDFQDLDYGEEILAATPLGGYLLIFTNQSIWKCAFTVNTDTGSAILNCFRIYTEPRNQDKCLAYPNTLVNTGFSIYYGGRDAIYEFDLYKIQPEATEWIYRGSASIFDDDATAIDTTACNSPIAEYHPETKEIHFSWPSPDAQQESAIGCEALPPIIGSGLNRHTLVINLVYQTCDYRDYGTTAMVNFKSDVGAQGTCNQTILFMGALASDFCLKEFGVGFAREVYDAVKDSYSMSGFIPRLRIIFPFGNFSAEKSIKSFRVDAIPDGDTGTVFKLRIGTTYEVVNPNIDQGNCGVQWKSFSDRAIKCPDRMSPAAYAALNIRPSNDFKWSFLARGRYLYAELSITNPDGSPATSGGVSLSRFDIQAVQL